MPNADIHELIVMNRDLINSTWQFFVSVHLALFGLVFLIDSNRVTNLSRGLMGVAYIGFMYLNYRAQIDNYTYLEHIVEAGRSATATDSPEALALAIASQAAWVTQYLFVIYVGASLGGLGLILIPHREKVAKPREDTADQDGQPRKRLPFL